MEYIWKGRNNMDFDLRKTAREKRIIVAHRGTCGGNIPCNTIASYEIALMQGADMIEIDVDMSADGELFIFHPGMESAHLNDASVHIPELTAAEVRRLRFVNQDDTPTQFGLNTLDEVLEQFKGRCYINCDKFWDHPREISDHIRDHGMMEQVLVKTSPKEELFDMIETYAPDVQYMVILGDEPGNIHEALKRRKINYMGQELCFKSEESPLCREEYLAMLHRDDILSWANSIIFNHRTQLAAGHSDDTALTVGMEEGWGWLARRGFDFIQTDWPLMLKMYLEEQGLLYR